jgi:putative SOS response-associated peptidase YedK
MCNDYGNRVPYSAYLEAFSQLKIRLFAAGGPPNLEPRDDIWPTDVAPIIRSADGGAELIQLRWGFPPGRPQGAAGHQHALRGAALPERPLSRSGFAFL